MISSLSAGFPHLLWKQMGCCSPLHLAFTVAFGMDILSGGAARFATTGKGG